MLRMMQHLWPHQLDGNLAIGKGIVGEIDDTGRPAPEFLHDFVFADPIHKNSPLPRAVLQGAQPFNGVNDRENGRGTREG